LETEFDLAPADDNATQGKNPGNVIGGMKAAIHVRIAHVFFLFSFELGAIER
jgi:hypothetical protein